MNLRIMFAGNFVSPIRAEKEKLVRAQKSCKQFACAVSKTGKAFLFNFSNVAYWCELSIKVCFVFFSFCELQLQRW